MSAVITLKQLKAQHPDVFEEHAETVRTETLKTERDRVNGHLVMGEDSGDMKTALEAIRNGDAMTMTLQSKYMMAAARRGAVEARNGDAAVVLDASSAAAVPDGKKPSDTGESPEADFGDRVLAALKARNGIR